MVLAKSRLTPDATLLHRITAEQYGCMLASGVLKDGDPIELIDGLLIRKDRAARKGIAL